MRYGLLFLLCTALAGTAQAEPLLLKNQGNSLSLSVYNQNLALVKDIRSAPLQTGNNDVIFDGVASQIQAETAIIYGDGITVNEQNYSYNLMSYDNFIKQYLGKEVTTVRINPTTGENIYEDATLIGDAGGRPILRFDYGIDADFPGRVIFNSVPADMSNQPTLAAKLNAKQGGEKNLYLAYLTGGLSWKTDYVANINSDDKLDLTGWVTLNNESGIDYEQAKIQLVAGDVHIVRPAMKRLLGAKSINMVAMANSMEESDMAYGIEPESVNSYELYTLPNMTTIKNMQTKQIALFEKHGVTYEKEFNLQMPYYFGNDGHEFKKLHPAITYMVENTADSHLGISLPAGTVRFYKNDKSGNLQFVGSDNINHTAKEDTLRLRLGESFNISVSGKVTKISEKEIERKPNHLCYNLKLLKTYEVETTVNNAEDTDNVVILSQNFPDTYKIINESIKSESKNANLRQWKVAAPKNEKTTLNYTVEITSQKRMCD
jgi:hypothetical protein